MAVKLGGVSAVCAALVLAMSACSDDDEPGFTGGEAGASGSSGKGGSAGKGGAGGSKSDGGSAGKGGGAGKGGTENSGGTDSAGGSENGAGSENGGGGSTGDGGYAGEGSAGGGAGGEAGGDDGGPTPGESCVSCAELACATELEACAASESCSAWQACAEACKTEACVRACDDTHDDAAILIAQVYACACDSCAAECSGISACEQSCVDDSGLPILTTPPDNLALTGLYANDGAAPDEIAPYVREYLPEYQLWSDGRDKRRWIYLPKCAQIDTTDMDHWVFPVGTRLWKEFSRDNVAIETRFLHRFGTGDDDWIMVTYAWPPNSELGGVLDPSLALHASPGGGPDPEGHNDIPSEGDCYNCHHDLKEHVLGFSAIQLSHDLPGVRFRDLVDWGILSHAPVPTGYDPPGDPTAQAALGYLHANCGNCHSQSGVGTTSEVPPAQGQSLWLRLLVDQTTVESTHTYITAVDEITSNEIWHATKVRIDPANPAESVVLQRLYAETKPVRMPGIREVRDEAGYAAVLAWIDSLQ